MKRYIFLMVLSYVFLAGFTLTKAQSWISKAETRNRHHVYAVGIGGVNSFLYNIPANINSQALNIHSLSVGLKMAVGLSLK